MKEIHQLLKIVLMLTIHFLALNCWAQTDSLQTDSLVVHTINGKAYYIHIVEKGESLYAIHQRYEVPIEILKKENPSVLDGLSIGERIFVPVKKKLEFEEKTDGNFITHLVKKKQTLYGIAKLYEVQQKAIVAANPTLAEGLKEGQEIKIPVVGLKKEPIPIDTAKIPKYPTHTVQQGETFYALSKRYNTTIDAIKTINGGLIQGLRAGEVIYVPHQAMSMRPTTEPKSYPVELGRENIYTMKLHDSLWINPKVSERKKEYDIALLLPFYLDANDTLKKNRGVLEKKEIHPKSKFAIEFLNGVEIALDSILTDSCKFKLHVYDTNGDDTARLKEIMKQLAIDTVDLILGPLYVNNFKSVAQFALQQQIPIISPVAQNNKLLLGNPFIFKAIPSKSTSLKSICNLVADSFKTENLLAIAHATSKEKTLITPYVKTYNDLILNTEDTTIYSAVKTLDVALDMNVVLDNLHPTQNNVIFVPSTNQTFVTKLIGFLTTTLNKKEYKNYTITLLGLEEWMRFENIELTYFQKLNVHYCTAQHINFKDALVNNFVKKTIQQKKVYPSSATFLGFDLSYFLGNNLKENGNLFSSNALHEYKGLSIQLNFIKTGVESGFENTSSFLLKFDDFTLKRVF